VRISNRTAARARRPAGNKRSKRFIVIFAG
jgi:hypothetical protein